MSEAADRPEHIDLAKLVDVRRAFERALDALAGGPSESAIAAAQAALYELRVVNGDWLWEHLEVAARHAERLMAAEAPSDPTQRRAASWQLVEDLLAGAGSDQLAEDVQQVIHARQFSQAIPTLRVQVEAFVSTAEAFADEPVPLTDDEEECAAWVKVAKVILEKAVDLLTNIAVAAAFTVTAVQLAAQRTILGATDLAERAVSQIGPAMPVLIGITAVAAEAAMGIQLIRDIWAPFNPTGRPDLIDQPARNDWEDPRVRLEELFDEVKGLFPDEDLADDPPQRASDTIDAAPHQLAALLAEGEQDVDPTGLDGPAADTQGVLNTPVDGAEPYWTDAEPDRTSQVEDPIPRAGRDDL